MTRAALPFSEHALQTAVCQYMDLVIRPPLYWTAVSNGGKRDLRTAVKLKREGLKAGTPDIVVLLPGGRVAWLELKIKGGKLSPAQRGFRDICSALGHYWGVAKTVDDVAVFLAAIGAVKVHQASQTKQKEKASGT